MSRPAICLNMIVKNESHIVHEVIDAVAPYIDYWVIVDTGSDDGTQDVIRSLMAERGIPGELHERPWVDFGHNRTEALQLAQGHADYIWVMDADDTIEGTLYLNDLTADCYEMRVFCVNTYWRPQLFKNGVAWRYIGVLHEYAFCDDPHTSDRLEGDYRILGRHLGARSRDPLTYQQDCEVLMAAVQENPDDANSVFYLAQSYEDLGDPVNARIWWERHTYMGDWDQMTYYSKLKLADTMDRLGEPWPDVMDAYLQAWEYRPIRADALLAIAVHYRTAGQYELGYLFAARAAEIPLPHNDIFFVFSEVYQWRAADEQAVCASWTGRQAEALAIWERLLTVDGIPDADRQRMLENRNLMATRV
ncbi:MAG: glycosyltransferase [Candidatus Nanopelagicales bacterium]